MGFAMTSKALPKAFHEALERHGMKAVEFARKTGIPESEVSRWKTDGKDPKRGRLKTIIRGGLEGQEGWKDNSSWLILRAHLMDECERAGMKGPFLQVGPGMPDDSLDHDVRRIDAFLRSNADLRKSLQLLATYLPQEADLRGVAETPDAPVVTSKVKDATYERLKSKVSSKKAKR